MRLFRVTGIHNKLALTFAVTVTLVIAVGLVGILEVHAVNNVTRELRLVWLPRMEVLGEMKRSLADFRVLTTDHADAADIRRLATFSGGMERTLNEFSAAQRQFVLAESTSAEEVPFSRFLEEWGAYAATVRAVAAELEAGRTGPAVAEFNETALARFGRASDTLDALIARTKANAETAAMRADSVYKVALNWTIAAIVAAALCAVVAVVWAWRNVSTPILKVSEAMRRLSAGDPHLDALKTSGQNDEINVLYAAVTGYRDSLDQSKELAEQAERERSRLQSAVNNMRIGLVMFDAEERLIVCNNRYQEQYGLPDELSQPGTSLEDILEHRLQLGNFEGFDPEEYAQRIRGLLERNEADAREVELKDGRVFSINFKPLPEGGWVATHEEITERRRAEERIHHMARHDALTDLPNRAYFGERIEEALARIPFGEHVAVLCLDLDRFKGVNDALGHSVGDELLRCVAQRLDEAVGEDDAVARFGGDEFAIVQTGVTQPKGAVALAHRLIETLSAPYDIHGHLAVIGVSVGVAVAPENGKDRHILLRNADMALYKAKSEGRGRYRLFKPEMDALMQDRRAMELDLRHAVKAGEFELHYQPIVQVASGRIVAFEALLRWHHPERGVVLPDDFIPLAEEIGLIVPIGEWVIREACAQAATWPATLRVAVNLSPAQFHSDALVTTVFGALARSHLAPGRLELEITENALLQDNEETMRLLHQLRQMGVRIAMDDFGTGYSSLSYVRSFPFDKIKIDGSFVREVSEKESAGAIVNAIAELSRSLGIATTAEGVETEEQRELVEAAGCTEIQGFLTGVPVPASELPARYFTSRPEPEAAAG